MFVCVCYTLERTEAESSHIKETSCCVISMQRYEGKFLSIIILEGREGRKETLADNQANDVVFTPNSTGQVSMK